MNYLAHALLSPDDEGVLIGNLAADGLVRGERAHLKASLSSGVDLHYLIDRITDAHPAFRRACRILSNRGIRYSGAFVDIVFDHILASGWERYSGCSFDLFRTRVYTVISTAPERLPIRFREMAFWIVSEDWFGDYRTIEGLHLALYRLSRRIKREIDLDLLYRVVDENLEDFRTCFASVWSGVRTAVDASAIAAAQSISASE